jgi:pantoate--beta-alanine ligase
MNNVRAGFRVALIGRGRMGTFLGRALAEAGVAVVGPLGRDFDVQSLAAPADAASLAAPADAASLAAPVDAVLLCVPDSEIARVASQLPAGLLVGHCSGATGLDSLAPHEAFSVHPLMTLVGEDSSPDVLAGASCAVAGSTPRALNVASRVATALRMRPFEVADDDRVAYHAAAAMASNFLVALEAAAERVAATAGVDREHLVPLVRATVENWAALGPERALTGPIARGDVEVVEGHRSEVGARAPELVWLFDELARAAAGLASRNREGGEQASSENGAAPTATGVDGRPPIEPLRTVEQVRRAVAAERGRGQTIGLVPTMGALHQGHLSLIRRARSDCDQVVVSIFVNPTQFGPGEDLETYPRDEQADIARARGAGATLVFAPPIAEVYPDGFATTVSVAGLSEGMEGASRGPEHFAGVTTVVAKLLNMVQPDAAYFGQKDAQQAVLIKRLARDLDFPTRIEVCPTVREPDGLARSSRNAYLNPEERERAVALRRGLDAVEDAVAAGERDASSLATLGREAMAGLGVEPEYLELVDAETLEPIETLSGRVLVAVAARVGAARLIDNTVIDPPTVRPPGPVPPKLTPGAAEPRSIPVTIPAGSRRTEIGAEPCSA